MSRAAARNLGLLEVLRAFNPDDSAVEENGDHQPDREEGEVRRAGEQPKRRAFPSGRTLPSPDS